MIFHLHVFLFIFLLLEKDGRAVAIKHAETMPRACFPCHCKASESHYNYHSYQANLPAYFPPEVTDFQISSHER